MSLWTRFTRAIRSIFGGAISAMEDPRLILEQNIRELNDQVPKMNENIATVKANVILLQKEVQKAEREQGGYTDKMKAAIQAGRDDIAQQYALRMEQARERLAGSREQLKYATAAYDKALQVKKAFMREKENKISQAREALRAHERAKWQGKVADALEQFEVGGVDQTHDEMIRRVNEETARNEARMELALDSVDSEAMQIEEDAESLRAADLVKQMKMEMGLLEPEAPAAAPRPSIEIDEELPASGDGRTLGRNRSQTSES
jgi:phage shock protein A